MNKSSCSLCPLSIAKRFSIDTASTDKSVMSWAFHKQYDAHIASGCRTASEVGKHKSTTRERITRSEAWVLEFFSLFFHTKYLSRTVIRQKARSRIYNHSLSISCCSSTINCPNANFSTIYKSLSFYFSCRFVWFLRFPYHASFNRFRFRVWFFGHSLFITTK